MKQATGIEMAINSLQFSELLKQQIPLVNKFYRSVYKQSVANKSEQVFTLKNQQILCAVRLKTVQGDLLLTGVACAPEYRQKGLASLLINNVLRLKNQNIYCFPYPHLQNFYERIGFEVLLARSLPLPLAQQYERYSRSKSLLCMVYRY